MPFFQNIIVVSVLTKKFKDFVAVDNVSFKVKKGEIFAFLGPNGAGKSTTIKMLTTLLKVSGGSILLDGCDPAEDKDKVRRTFGIVFQDPSLDDDLTALENINLHAALHSVPYGQRKARIEEMLKFVDLWERRNNLVKTFSGGMKRRLEIARGLLLHPKILFLDEPTIGLDPQTRNHMWEYLKGVNKKEGTTIFSTTHYMEEAEKIADKIAIIDNGKLIAIGSYSELKNKTKTSSLEEAFLSLTSRKIREEEVTGIDNLRNA